MSDWSADEMAVRRVVVEQGARKVQSLIPAPDMLTVYKKVHKHGAVTSKDISELTGFNTHYSSVLLSRLCKAGYLSRMWGDTPPIGRRPYVYRDAVKR
jgi:transcription initiation factor IIE alpha subunit